MPVRSPRRDRIQSLIRCSSGVTAKAIKIETREMTQLLLMKLFMLFISWLGC